MPGGCQGLQAKTGERSNGIRTGRQNRIQITICFNCYRVYLTHNQIGKRGLASRINSQLGMKSQTSRGRDAADGMKVKVGAGVSVGRVAAASIGRYCVAYAASQAADIGIASR